MQVFAAVLLPVELQLTDLSIVWASDERYFARLGDRHETFFACPLSSRHLDERIPCWPKRWAAMGTGPAHCKATRRVARPTAWAKVPMVTASRRVPVVHPGQMGPADLLATARRGVGRSKASLEAAATLYPRLQTPDA